MKVAVLCGGRSFERAVSLRSGAAVEEALHELGHDAIMLDADARTALALRDLAPDCVVIALHGRGGEDGTVQELLELLELPYTGSGPAASAAAFNKAHARRILTRAGVPVPEGITLTLSALQDYGASTLLSDLEGTLEFPVVVKPARGGSALGIRFAESAEAVPGALVTAMSYDKHVVIERYVEGREVSISLVGYPTLEALPPVRVLPRNSDWYDFESRYTHGETDFACPPDDMSIAEIDAARDAALRAAEALGLVGVARVDMIVDSDGTPWVVDVNSIPGMTDTSLLPVACEAAGISRSAFVQQLLDSARATHAAS